MRAIKKEDTPYIQAFREIGTPMHQALLEQYPQLQEIYDRIGEYNEAFPSSEE